MLGVNSCSCFVSMWQDAGLLCYVFFLKQEKRIFTNFHRQLFCWIDKWIDLTIEDIRRMEDETQNELEAVRAPSG